MPVASFSKKADLGVAGPGPAARGKLSPQVSLKGLLAGTPSSAQRVKSGAPGEGIMEPSPSGANLGSSGVLPGNVLKKGRI